MIFIGNVSLNDSSRNVCHANILMKCLSSFSQSILKGDCRPTPSHRETFSQSNAVSHWFKPRLSSEFYPRLFSSILQRDSRIYVYGIGYFVKQKSMGSSFVKSMRGSAHAWFVFHPLAMPLIRESLWILKWQTWPHTNHVWRNLSLSHAGQGIFDRRAAT